MIRDKNAEECDLPAGRQAQRKSNSSTNADDIKNIFGLNSIQTIFCYSNLSLPLEDRGLFYSDHTDLHIYKLWQCGYLYSFSCRKCVVCIKIFSIHFIHF